MCVYILEISGDFLRFIFSIPVEEDSISACDRSPAVARSAEDVGGPAVPCWGGDEHKVAG